MLRLVITVLFLTGAAAFVRAAPSPAGSKNFESWTATCNNIGTCVVLGSSSDDQLFYLRFQRDAGAMAAPALKIAVAGQSAVKGEIAFRLKVNDQGKTTPLGPFVATREPDNEEAMTAKVEAGEPTLTVIEAIRNAETLDYDIGPMKGRLDLKGLSAALRYIDAQQGRAGTPTALVARGMTPIGQVASPRSAPVLTPAPAGSVSEIEKPTLSRALLARALSGCDPDTVKAPDSVQAWRLGRNRVLVAVSCERGAYNFESSLYLTDEAGGGIKPLVLPQPQQRPGGDNDINTETNVAFDVKTMELSAFDKGRGLGDCGTMTSWLWTGTTFELLSASELDACPGALPDDWPNLYTAVRKK